MPVEHDTVTIGEMLADAAKQKLVLPNFQREYVWTVEAQRKLLASVLSDIPMGAFLLLHGDASDFVSRRVALTEEATPTTECVFLLDGQQRLSTLMSIFFSPLFTDESWKMMLNLLPRKLRYVWTLRVIPEGDEADIFGYYSLDFPHGIDIEPDDILSRLSPAQIYMKDEKNDGAWFHPNWKADLEPGERYYEVSRASAKRGLVPLWGLMNEPENRLVDTSLQVIAGEKCVALQAGANFEKQPALYDALRRADPTLPRLWQEASPEKLGLAFYSLAARWRSGMATFIKEALQRTTSAIRLRKEDVGRAAAIFEVINQGGRPLAPFDLTVARNARDPRAKNLNLELVNWLQEQEIRVTPALWFEHGVKSPIDSWSIEGRDICVSAGSLTTVFKNSFLNLLSLKYHSKGGDPAELEVSHIKKNKILSISADGIANNWESVSLALLRAWAFLQIRCGIIAEASLRYKLMLLPIAYTFLEGAHRWDDAVLHAQLEYWYWTALFAGVFRERQNENAISEVKTVFEWCVRDSSAAETRITDRSNKVLAVEGYSDKDAFIPKEPDAAIGSDVSSAILQYVLSLGPFDFTSGKAVRLFAWQGEELEDHHIVPLGSAATLKASASELRARGDDFVLNSPLNRTFISRRANRIIAAKSPTQYWDELTANQPGSHLLPQTKSAYSFDLNDPAMAGATEYLELRFERLKEELEKELHNLLQMK